MLDKTRVENVLFVDVETVPVEASYDSLKDDYKELWQLKHDKLRIDDQLPSESFADRGGIYSEFGKIVCISVGIIPPATGSGPLLFRLKSFYGDDERELLNQFAEMLRKHFNDSEKYGLCGHNIKEFDIPYICRRMLINSVRLPELLNLYGKKPWEVNHLDTLHLWRFGDYKSYTSLKLLTTLFDIPTPKDDIDGKDVAKVYWVDRDIKRIVTYCQKDVLAVAQLLLRFKGLPLIKEENIEYV